MSYPSRPIIAICEDAAFVRSLWHKFKKKKEKIDIWIALTPPAAVALEKKNIRYHIVDDFIDESSLSGKLDERLRHYIDWANWVDLFLKNKIPEFSESNINPFIIFFYYLVNFFDRFTVVYTSLQSCFTHFRPSKILFKQSMKQNNDYPDKGNYDRVSILMPHLAQKHEIELKVFKSTTQDFFFKLISNKAKIITSFLRTRGSILKKILSSGRFQKDINSSNYENRFEVLILQEFYEVKHIISELKALGAKLVYPKLNGKTTHIHRSKKKQIGKALQEAWNEIVCNPKFLIPIDRMEEGREFIEEWLQKFWNTDLLEFLASYKACKKNFRNRKNNCILVSNTQGLNPYSIWMGYLYAARNAKIPVFSFTHGSLSGFCHQPIQIFWDMPHSDYHFSFGPGVSNYLNRVSSQFDYRFGTAFAGGSPRIDAIKKNENSKKIRSIRNQLSKKDPRPLILYIPTVLNFNRRITGDAYACMPYFDFLKDIIGVFSRHKNVKLIYRNFVSQWPNLLPNLIKTHLPDAIIADPKDYELTDLLYAVDGIIIDFPSTALSEILLSKKPILVYSDKRYVQMFPEAKLLLQKRAIVKETQKDFLISVENFLKTEEFKEIQYPNNEFRKFYITDYDDNLSANRIAKVIANEIQELNKQSC